MKALSKKELKRFNALIDTTPGLGPKGRCHVWTGADSGGASNNCYGKFKLRGKTQAAHRIAYFITTGVWPTDLEVCHKCDFTLCVKSTHLFDGTHSDNMQDCYDKGRRHQRGEYNGNAKLSLDQVASIRTKYATGNYRQVDLGMLYGVTQAMVSDIVTNKHWQH